jgi:hypothetical protein
MSNLIMKRIATRSEWHSLKNDWTTLWEHSHRATCFLTWEWLTAWAQISMTDRRELFILAIYGKDSLVGICPFYICRLNRFPAA